MPFEIPDSWEWCRLSDLVIKEIKRGKSPVYAEKGTAMVFAQKCNTKAGKIDLDLAKFLSEAALPKYPDDEYMKNNDIIVNSTGTGTLGRIGIYHDSDNTKNIPLVADSHVTIVRTPENITMYIYHILKYYQPLLEESGEGSTKQKELKPDKIKELFIPIPPLSEQHRIVAKIEELLPFIEKYAQAETQLIVLNTSFPEALKKSILQEAVQGRLVPQYPNDEPASVLLERIRAEKQALIKAGKIKKDKHESVIVTRDKIPYEIIDGKEHCIADEVPFEIPEGWAWCRLDSAVLLTTDYVANGSFATLRENVKSYKTPNYALLVKTQDFSNNFTQNLTYTDKAGYDFLSKSVLYGGELMLSNIGASIGKAFIIPNLDIPMTLAPNSIMLKCMNDSMTSFLRYLILSFYGQSLLIGFTEGTAMPKFSKTQLRNALIPIPPLAEQKRIVTKIEELMQYCDKL